MPSVNVILIGGAPGSGKTTLGRELAARLGSASVTVDDLLTVAQAVTTPQSHAGLHVMSRVSHLEYYTESSVDQLMADAEAQHQAAWVFVERLVSKRATWDPAQIVIDGWHLRPRRVAELGLANVWSGWIVATPNVLVERERSNLAWMQASRDPERMFEHFIARSLRFNALIEREAIECGMTVLRQTGEATVEALCDMVVEAVSD